MSIYPAGIPHDIYFADGDAVARLFADPTYHVPKQNLLLARLAKEENDASAINIETTRSRVSKDLPCETIERWFLEQEQADGAGSVDHLLHGTRGKSPDDVSNTIIHLWNNERMTVREFRRPAR